MHPNNRFTQYPASFFGPVGDGAGPSNVVQGQQLPPSTLPTLSNDNVTAAFLAARDSSVPSFPRDHVQNNTAPVPPTQPQMPPVMQPVAMTLQQVADILNTSQNPMDPQLLQLLQANFSWSQHQEFPRRAQIQDRSPAQAFSNAIAQLAPMADLSMPAMGPPYQHCNIPTTSSAAPPPGTFPPQTRRIDNSDFVNASQISNFRRFNPRSSNEAIHGNISSAAIIPTMYQAPIQGTLASSPFGFAQYNTNQNSVPEGFTGTIGSNNIIATPTVPPSAHMFPSPQPGALASPAYDIQQMNSYRNSASTSITGANQNQFYGSVASTPTAPTTLMSFSAIQQQITESQMLNGTYPSSSNVPDPSSASFPVPIQNTDNSQLFGMQQPNTIQNLEPETPNGIDRWNNNAATSTAAPPTQYNELPVQQTTTSQFVTVPQQNIFPSTAPATSNGFFLSNNIAATSTASLSTQYNELSIQQTTSQFGSVPQQNDSPNIATTTPNGIYRSNSIASTSSASPSSHFSEYPIQQITTSQLRNVPQQNNSRSIVSGTSNRSPHIRSAPTPAPLSVSAPPTISGKGKARGASMRRSCTPGKENQGKAPNRPGRPRGVKNGQGRNHGKYQERKERKKAEQELAAAQICQNRTSTNADAQSSPPPRVTASVPLQKRTPRPRPVSVPILNQLPQPLQVLNEQQPDAPPSPASSTSSSVSSQELSPGSKRPPPSPPVPNEDVPPEKRSSFCVWITGMQSPYIDRIENGNQECNVSPGTQEEPATESQESMEVEPDTSAEHHTEEEEEEQEQDQEGGAEQEEQEEEEQDQEDGAEQEEEEQEEQDQEDGAEQEEEEQEEQDQEDGAEQEEEEQEEQDQEDGAEQEDEEKQQQEEQENKEQEERKKRVTEFIRNNKDRPQILQLYVLEPNKGRVCIREDNYIPPKFIEEGSLEEVFRLATLFIGSLQLREILFQCLLDEYMYFSDQFTAQIFGRISDEDFHIKTDAVIWHCPCGKGIHDFVHAFAGESLPRAFMLRGRNSNRYEVHIEDRRGMLDSGTNGLRTRRARRPGQRRPALLATRERVEVEEVQREQEEEQISEESSNSVAMPCNISEAEVERTAEEEEALRKQQEEDDLRKQQEAEELRRKQEVEQRFIEQYQKNSSFLKLTIFDMNTGEVLLQTLLDETEPVLFNGEIIKCFQIVKQYLSQNEFEKFIIVWRHDRTIEQAQLLKKTVTEGRNDIIRVKTILWVGPYNDGLNRLLSIWSYESVPEVYERKDGGLWLYPTEQRFNEDPVINQKTKIRVEEKYLDSIEEEQSMEEDEAVSVQSGAPEAAGEEMEAEEVREPEEPEQPQDLEVPQEFEVPLEAEEVGGPEQPEQPEQPQDLAVPQEFEDPQEPEVVGEPEQLEELEQLEDLDELEEPEQPEQSQDLAVPQEFEDPQEPEVVGEPEDLDELEEPEQPEQSQDLAVPQEFEDPQEPEVVGEPEDLDELEEPEQQEQPQDLAVPQEFEMPLEAEQVGEPDQLEDLGDPVQPREPRDQEERAEPEGVDEEHDMWIACGLVMVHQDEEPDDDTESSDGHSSTSGDNQETEEVSEEDGQKLSEHDGDNESLDSSSSTSVDAQMMNQKLAGDFEKEEGMEETAAVEKEAEQSQATAPEEQDDVEETNKVQDEILIPQSGQEENLQQAEDEDENEQCLLQENSVEASESSSFEFEKRLVNEEPTETSTSNASSSSTDAKLGATEQSAASGVETCAKREESIPRAIKEERGSFVAGEEAMDQNEVELEALPSSSQCKSEDKPDIKEDLYRNPDKRSDNAEDDQEVQTEARPESVGQENQEPVAKGVQENVANEEEDQVLNQECYDRIRIGSKYDKFEDIYFVEIIENGRTLVNKIVTREKAAHLLVDYFEKYDFEELEFVSDEEADDLQRTIKMLRVAITCRIEKLLVKKFLFDCEGCSKEDDFMQILDVVDSETLEEITIGECCRFGPKTQLKGLQNGKAFPQLQSLVIKCTLPQLPISQFSDIPHLDLYPEAANTTEVTGYLKKFNKNFHTGASSTPSFDFKFRTGFVIACPKLIEKLAKNHQIIGDTHYFEWTNPQYHSLVLKFQSHRITGKYEESALVKGKDLSIFFE